jgi:hypothetical protein
MTVTTVRDPPDARAIAVACSTALSAGIDPSVAARILLNIINLLNELCAPASHGTALE